MYGLYMRYKPFAEDVYPLPTLNHSLQHDHQQHKQHNNPDPAETAQLDIFSAEPPMTEIFTSPTAGPSTEAQSIPTPVEVIPTLLLSGNPVIPPINAYGTFSHTSNPGTSHPHIAHRSFSTSSTDSSVSTDDENRMLLPSHVPRKEGVMNNVSGDLIPFANVFGHFFMGMVKTKRKVFGNDLENGLDTPDESNTFVNANDESAQRRWAESGE